MTVCPDCFKSIIVNFQDHRCIEGSEGPKCKCDTTNRQIAVFKRGEQSWTFVEDDVYDEIDDWRYCERCDQMVRAKQ